MSEGNKPIALYLRPDDPLDLELAAYFAKCTETLGPHIAAPYDERGVTNTKSAYANDVAADFSTAIMLNTRDVTARLGRTLGIGQFDNACPALADQCKAIILNYY